MPLFIKQRGLSVEQRIKITQSQRKTTQSESTQQESATSASTPTIASQIATQHASTPSATQQKSTQIATQIASTQGKITRTGGNVKQILQSFALENKVNPLTLDYNLISYKSFIVRDGAKMPIDNSAIKSHIDSNNAITQDYEIEIFRRVSSFYPILIQVHTNENATALSANIYTQRIPRTGSLEQLIYQTILNICAYRGIIINMGWVDMKAKIIEIAQKLRTNQTHPEFYTIEMCKLKEPVINAPATRLLLSKSQNASILSLESPLLSGGFFPVESGEVLLQYHKPRYASPWRNIYGVIYGIALSYPIGVTAGNNIAVAQKDDLIIYSAESSGYISVVNGVMMVSQSIIVDNINAKNLKNIKEQNIQSLIVKNDALLKDAVPSGFDLNVADLKIVGNIGATQILSQNLIINGQVHIKSDLKAKRAQILHLKGRLHSKEAQIRHCENAQVECDNLLINYLNGSKIYCNDARISRVQGNNAIFVQHSLTIGRTMGENNDFIFHPCAYGEKKAEFAELSERLFRIQRLKNILAQDAKNIQLLKTTNELIYEHLSQKHKEQSRAWGELLGRIGRKNSDINEISFYCLELSNDIDKKVEIISSQLRAKQDEMFNIEVVFEERAQVGFFVRFMDFHNIEHRYFVNASQNRQIKRVKLERGEDDGIKIACYKD